MIKKQYILLILVILITAYMKNVFTINVNVLNLKEYVVQIIFILVMPKLGEVNYE